MSKQIQLNLPGELYDLIRQLAQRNHLTTDEFIVGALSRYFTFDGPFYPYWLTLSQEHARKTNLPPEVPEEVMETYTDESLWAIVDLRLDKSEDKRLEKLLDARQKGNSTSSDEKEINALMEKINHQMLERTKALMILQKRGFDVPHYLKTGKR